MKEYQEQLREQLENDPDRTLDYLVIKSYPIILRMVKDKGLVFSKEVGEIFRPFVKKGTLGLMSYKVSEMMRWRGEQEGIQVDNLKNVLKLIYGEHDKMHCIGGKTHGKAIVIYSSKEKLREYLSPRVKIRRILEFRFD